VYGVCAAPEVSWFFPSEVFVVNLVFIDLIHSLVLLSNRLHCIVAGLLKPWGKLVLVYYV
jgi:hypothetical protein